MSRKKNRRRMSVGTVFMLTLLTVVLCGSALVLSRLSSGASVDLSRLSMDVLDLRTEAPAGEDIPVIPLTTAKETAPQKETKTAAPTRAPKDTPTPKPKAAQFTMTLAGSISLSGEVRKNSKTTDTGKADYADIMMLIAKQIRSDLNCVFLENILSDKEKASDTVAPVAAADLLNEGRFNIVACGFSQAYAKGKSGVDSTLKALSSRDIRTVGIRKASQSDSPEIIKAGGIKVSVLQYTGNVASKTRKSMEKDGTSGMVPAAELSQITSDISAARKKGAEAVIVLLHWGKDAKDPDKTQKDLAAGIAKAGADLIVGNGSHVPQTAEYLKGKSGKSVLCVWSLGSLLSGDRNSVKKTSGYLLHVTFRSNGKGGVDVLNPEYTPVYTWKYKQDGRYYYRCIASDRSAPDGMDSDQKKAMKKSADAVASVLKNAPLSKRDK